ncbi:hypothetical protein Zmor_006371 [Zophobas morio]|uniref:RNA-directed DNA polymerase from mobile element jockey n=1 Tax=Zophobas morio TaxID=2755281 RepID=A0AA38MNC2_9CUCU|nr:hypothetical protein Zmor_006371 [Zophobas morio]
MHTLFSRTEKARELTSNIKREIRTGFDNVVKLAEKKVKSDPPQLWSYINTKKGTSRIPGTMENGNNGEKLKDPLAIVNGFASHFSSVFRKDNTTNPKFDTEEAVCDKVDCDNKICDNLQYQICDSIYDTTTNIPVLHNFSIDVDDILKAARKIKANYTMGIDHIPGFFVRDFIPCLSTPLCYLFNLIMQTFTFPECWKIARVCAIHKSGSKSDIKKLPAGCDYP